MTCAKAKRLLDEYRDGELPESRRSACEAHLAACPACRQALDRIETLYSGLHGWEEARASEELTARVTAAWQARWPKKRRVIARQRLAGRLAAAAGAAAIAGAAGLAVMHLPVLLSAGPARPPLVAQGSEAWLEELLPELAFADPQPATPREKQEPGQGEFRGSAVQNHQARC